MTIAAGFVCADGMLLCADRQFTGQVKLPGTKLWDHRDGDLRILTASAGDAALMRLAEEGITDGVNSQTSLIDAREGIEAVLERLHIDYIDKRIAIDPSYGVDLIVAIRTIDGFELLEHQAWAVVPVERTRGFACIGSGSILGTYVADQLFHPGQTAAGTAVVATHVLQIAKRYDPWCGFGSDIRALAGTGDSIDMSVTSVAQIEGFFDEVYRTLRPLLFVATNAELKHAPETYLKPHVRNLVTALKAAPPVPFTDLRRHFPHPPRGPKQSSPQRKKKPPASR
jgi:hypothetical protein